MSLIKWDKRPVYNILLLGESGAGKSTFINSFINYSLYETLNEAQEHELHISIPVRFTVTDDEDKDIEVKEGQDDNENLDEVAHSSTVSCKSYIIKCAKYYVRLIDTPGVGSTVKDTDANKEHMDKHEESVQQDRQYIKDVLNYISHFDSLYAIAVVVKFTETRYNSRFQLCLKQLLANFNKSAIDNLLFISTFGTSTDTVKGPLKLLLSNMNAANYSLSKKTIYRFDNKSLRFILGAKHGAKYDRRTRKANELSWEESRDECQRLLKYIIGDDNEPGLKPHNIKDSLAINEARKLIEHIEPVLDRIEQTTMQNKAMLEAYSDICNRNKDAINTFKRLMDENHLDVEVVMLDSPQTVCKSSKCLVNVSAVGGMIEHYLQVCCTGCKAFMFMRLLCEKFSLLSGNCIVCKCHVSNHQRMYYGTIVIRKDMEEKELIMSKLEAAINAEQQIQLLIKYIHKQIELMKNELFIVHSAKNTFANFIRTNAIIPSVTSSASVEDETIFPFEVFDVKNQLINLKKFGPVIEKAIEIAEKGERKEWDAAKEVAINVKSAVGKWIREHIDSSYT